MTREPPPVPPPDDAPDWIDRVVDLAARLGANEVRLRWKLMQLRDRWTGALAHGAEAVERSAVESVVCPDCGRLNDRSDRRCTRCDAPLPTRLRRLLARLGLVGFHPAPASAALGAAILLVYVRVALSTPEPSLLDPPWLALYAFGGHLPASVQAGEYWRLATAFFLHSGVWHLGFNLAALSQVGPLVETAFGSGIALFLFAVTGILSFAGSQAMGIEAMSVGASGAIMGLIGAAAVAGHRLGTARGVQLRDGLLAWAAYSVVFGVMVGANNHAHAAGFLAGALLGTGLALRGGPEAPDPARDRFLGTLGAAILAITLGLALHPPRGLSALPGLAPDEAGIALESIATGGSAFPEARLPRSTSTPRP